MSATRREVIRGIGQAAIGASLAVVVGEPAQAQQNPAFRIEEQFAAFMRDLGGSSDDGGGQVTFTGRDPFVQSRFRTGACMAIPAMGAGVGAAAIWRERTGQTQDLSVDLRQAVYSVAPWARLLVEELRAVGMLPGDPLPTSWSWQPTLNDRPLQAPLAIGNPLSFAIFETKDSRRVTPTGLYPQHFVGFLRVIGAAPDPASIAARIRTFDSADLEQRVGEAGMIMGIHRTPGEWGRASARAGRCRYPAGGNHQTRRQRARAVVAEPDRASVGHPRARLRSRDRQLHGGAQPRRTRRRGAARRPPPGLRARRDLAGREHRHALDASEPQGSRAEQGASGTAPASRRVHRGFPRPQDGGARLRG
jgi:hypothetical protein